MKKRGHIKNILGVRFLIGSVDLALDAVLEGGQLVAPSGPGMAGDLEHSTYAAAVGTAEVAITDSGFMVLCWWLLKGEWLERVSGLQLTERILEREAERLSVSGFWVMPTEDDRDALVAYLGSRGIESRPEQFYVAPFYERDGPKDGELVERLEKYRPEIVMVCLGGGIQESLGAYLKARLSYRPAIICIGAAIAFLTGRQVGIPKWLDRMFLGWFCRICSNRRLYLDRYYRSILLVWKIHRFGGETADD